MYLQMPIVQAATSVYTAIGQAVTNANRRDYDLDCNLVKGSGCGQATAATSDQDVDRKEPTSLGEVMEMCDDNTAGCKCSCRFDTSAEVPGHVQECMCITQGSRLFLG